MSVCAHACVLSFFTSLCLSTYIRLCMIYKVVVRMEYNILCKNTFANDEVLKRSFNDDKNSTLKAFSHFTKSSPWQLLRLLKSLICPRPCSEYFICISSVYFSSYSIDVGTNIHSHFTDEKTEVQRALVRSHCWQVVETGFTFGSLTPYSAVLTIMTHWPLALYCPF